MSSELDIRQPYEIGKAAFKAYDDDLIRLIRSSIMPPEATTSDTYYLLQLSARYGLDPFAREIWAAKMKGRTGEQGGVAILVGRDGLLAIAERSRSFRGFRNQVVCENDSFEYDAEPREMPDGTFTHVRHTWGKPQDRGPILGAWAEVYREGRPPVFFYAPLDEYIPKSEKKLEYSPWRSMKSVMIGKCALATALRLAFRISGLYIEEELAEAMSNGKSVDRQALPDYGEDPKLALRLADLFAACEATVPGSFLPGKIRVTLAQRDTQEKKEALALELEEFIGKHGGVVPEERPADEEFERVEEADVELEEGPAEGDDAASHHQ